MVFECLHRFFRVSPCPCTESCNQAFIFHSDKEKMAQIMDWIREALHLLGDIVKSSQEFSLCDSLDRLKEYAPVNPVFEHTLKGNAENSYCRTYITELFDATLFHGSDAPWIQHEKPLCDTDGGHGMVFYDLNGKRFYVVHTPNSRQEERPMIIPF